jgi:hypothetical protein
MCFGYNSCMVALTNISANFPQRPLRVRAHNHRYRLGAERCSKSNSQASLRKATYDESNRLEACSKDPIGYQEGFSTFEYVGSQPCTYIDPEGLMSWPPNLNLPTIGVIGFVQAPLFYFPGGGIFFRASKEAQVGSCDCGCGVMGGYAKYSTTIEFGVFLGIMTPNIHVSTPFVQELAACPAPEDVITGGVTIRGVAGSLVGTCRFRFSNSGISRSCSGSIRWTSWQKGLNVQITGYVQIRLATNTCKVPLLIANASPI